MSVDLPAPFSPSSAWTSPLRSSRLTLSLATSVPKRLVMPRSSSASGALELRDASGYASPDKRSLLDRVRRSDRPGDDLRLDRVDLGEDRPGHDGPDADQIDAALGETVDVVRAAVVDALLQVLDRQEDGLIDLLHRRGEHLRPHGLL